MGKRIEKPILLLTRPRASSEAFARQFHARFGADWPVLISPLIEIDPLDGAIPPAEALIFTSQHAVRVFAEREDAMGRVAYCVGARTAQAARKAGFHAIAGEGGAEALIPVIKATYSGERLLHARGEEIAFDLAKALDYAGIETNEIVLYRQVSVPLSPDARAALRGETPLLIPIFSPNSARALTKALPDHHAPLFVAAISAAVADICQPSIYDLIEVAPTADAVGVLEALNRLLRAQMAG